MLVPVLLPTRGGGDLGFLSEYWIDIMLPACLLLFRSLWAIYATYETNRRVRGWDALVRGGSELSPGPVLLHAKRAGDRALETTEGAIVDLDETTPVDVPVGAERWVFGVLASGDRGGAPFRDETHAKLEPHRGRYLTVGAPPRAKRSSAEGPLIVYLLVYFACGVALRGLGTRSVFGVLVFLAWFFMTIAAFPVALAARTIPIEPMPNDPPAE